MLALKYIHSLNILHRDLKTSNIFLQENGDLKIGDFGIARVLEGTMHNAESVVGTPYYMSPEICQNQPYSYKSDVWSLGCVLYELCTLEHAFKSNNLLNLVYKIVHEDPDPISTKYSSDMQNLINLLVKKNLSERPTLDQLIHVDFVRLFLFWFSNTDQMDNNEGKKLIHQSDQNSKNVNDEEQNKQHDRKRLYSDSAHGLSNIDKTRSRICSFEPIGYQAINTFGDEMNDRNRTPMEKLKYRKEAEAKKREEEVKKAIRSNLKITKLSESQINGIHYSQNNGSPYSLNHLSGENAINRAAIKSSLEKSALKSNGRNVIKNFETELLKNSKNLQLTHSQSDVKDRHFMKNGSNVSKMSFKDTLKQNLEETIQSQFFPDIKNSFVKSKSMLKQGQGIENNDDFPPDFDDFDEFFQ